MLHVFVETNWVIDLVSPFQPDGSARKLLEFANAAKIQLHIPGICLNEAKNKITQLKAQARNKADGVRAFLKSKPEGLSELNKDIVFRTLDSYESAHSAEIGKFEGHLQALFKHPNVEVFALDDEMLKRALELTGGEFAVLDPFDQSILAGILVRAENLKGSGPSVFCEKDMDLWDFNKNKEPKPWLAGLYSRAGLRIHPNFDISEFLRET